MPSLTPGVATQDTVRAELGTPSLIPEFNPNTWYYSGERTRRWAFLTPEVDDSLTLAFYFDENGILLNVVPYTLKNRQEISPENKKTASQGGSPSFINQALGAFGRVANR